MNGLRAGGKQGLHHLPAVSRHHGRRQSSLQDRRAFVRRRPGLCHHADENQLAGAQGSARSTRPSVSLSVCLSNVDRASSPIACWMPQQMDDESKTAALSTVNKVIEKIGQAVNLYYAFGSCFVEDI